MQTRTQNYTAGDAPRLLEDLGLDQQVHRDGALALPPWGSGSTHCMRQKA